MLDALGPPCLSSIVGMKREPTYRTGEPIREGDKVRIGKWDGLVETIITNETVGWEDYWREKGKGVMLSGPAFGRLYTRLDDEDLVFVGRNQK